MNPVRHSQGLCSRVLADSNRLSLGVIQLLNSCVNFAGSSTSKTGMRPFFAFLTAASVLLHATVGCCAHEAHGETLGGCTHHAHEAHSGDTSDSHGVAESSIAELGTAACDHPSHEAPHGCDHGDCDWPAPELRQATDALSASLVASFSWMVAPVPVEVAPSAQKYGTWLAGETSLALPVRTHVAHCVFLI